MDAREIRDYTVDRTVDEFDEARYFVCDENGDWIGMPYDSAEAAFEEIERLRERKS